MSRDYYERDTRPLSPREEYEMRTGTYRGGYDDRYVDPRGRGVDPREVSRARYVEPQRNDWDARRETHRRDVDSYHREPVQPRGYYNQSFESKIPVVEDTYRETRQVSEPTPRERVAQQRPAPQSVRVGSSEGVPIQLTKVRKTWSIGNPYPVSFNSDKEYKLVVKTSDGVVEQVIKKKDVSVKYTDHEMDSNVKVKNLPIATGAKVLGPWVDFNAIKTEDAVNTPINFTEIECIKHSIGGAVYSFDEVRASNVAELVKLGKDPYETMVLSNFNLAKVVYASPEDINIIKGILVKTTMVDKGSSIDEFHYTLTKVKDKLTSNMVFDVINSILTEGINYILNAKFGIDWTIDNFADGWRELKEAIISDIDEATRGRDIYGENDIFNGINVGLCADLLKPLTKYKIEDNGLLTLTDESVCGFIPIKAEDLCLTVDETGSLLRDDNIIKLARGIIDVDKTSYISTIDNIVFRVTYGTLNPEAIIIKKV